MNSAKITIVMAGLVASLPAIAAAQQVERKGRTPSDLGLHGYSLVLAIGDMQAAAGASATAETVPPAARKALTDMQAFLPFKRYQLVDAAWMLCCGSGFQSATHGQIRGPADSDYSFAIETINSSDDGKLTVRFFLRDDTGTAETSSSSGGGRGAVTAQRSGAVGRTRAPSSRSVMDTTFSITIGETVVIGTSRIKGDQALIALLTAAGKPDAPRR